MPTIEQCRAHAADYKILGKDQQISARRSSQLVASFICRCDPMSPVGTKRTSRPPLPTSVLGGKADLMFGYGRLGLNGIPGAAAVRPESWRAENKLVGVLGR